MSASPPSEPTGDFYSQHARAYAEQTLGVGMGPLYDRFLALVPAGGHVLDAGSGSGRDTRVFRGRGYRVTAIDASPELAQLAGEVIGQPVLVMRFQGLTFEDEFDGVWACASLLHVPRAEMDGVFARFSRALRPGGVWYVSFKLGGQEEVRGGRLFSDYTEESFRALLRRHPGLELVEVWRTGDPRGQVWLNAILRRGESLCLERER
jgi:SAM-dependent methyltransferase